MVGSNGGRHGDTYIWKSGQWVWYVGRRWLAGGVVEDE
jgi:hypothetical protein